MEENGRLTETENNGRADTENSGQTDTENSGQTDTENNGQPDTENSGQAETANREQAADTENSGQAKTKNNGLADTGLNRQADDGEMDSSDREYKEHPVQHILTLVFNLMIVNVLTVLCAIPVFTAGASFSAMSGVLVRLTEGDDSGVAVSFFRSFRSNFQDATMLYLFYLPVFLIDISCIALSRTGLAVIPGFVFVILFAVSVVFLGSAVYGGILVNRYKNTAAATFRNTWILAFGYLPKTAVAVLSYAASGAIVYLTWPWLGSLALLFGLSLPGYASVKAVLPAIREQEEKAAGRGGM